MKLVTYSNSDTTAIGALLEDSICPFANDSSLPDEMKAFLEGGEVNMNKATLAMFTITPYLLSSM